MSIVALYFLVIMDNIRGMFIGFTVVGWIAVGVTLMISGITLAVEAGSCHSGEDKVASYNKVFLKTLKVFLPIVIVITMITSLIPTTKEVAFIYIVGKLSQSKTMSNIGDHAGQIPEKALAVLNMKLDEYMKDMENEAEKKVTDQVEQHTR